MANQDIKALFGYLILLGAIIGVVLSFAATHFTLAVLFVVGGLLTWMIYVNVAQVLIHRQTGAILIIFGVLLASAVFLAFGIEQDMWGGYRLKPEGAILSFVLLLFGIMPGLIFYYYHKPTRPIQPPQARADQPSETPRTPPPSSQPESPGVSPEEYAEWAEQTLPEGYEYYDPELLAAYYEGEYEEEEEEENNEDSQ
ncbi:MAG: hypothetical protein ACE5HZ_02410 [Fidelibacterota bacterium]